MCVCVCVCVERMARYWIQKSYEDIQGTIFSCILIVTEIAFSFPFGGLGLIQDVLGVAQLHSVIHHGTWTFIGGKRMERTGEVPLDTSESHPPSGFHDLTVRFFPLG